MAKAKADYNDHSIIVSGKTHNVETNSQNPEPIEAQTGLPSKKTKRRIGENLSIWDVLIVVAIVTAISVSGSIIYDAITVKASQVALLSETARTYATLSEDFDKAVTPEMSDDERELMLAQLTDDYAEKLGEKYDLETKLDGEGISVTLMTDNTDAVGVMREGMDGGGMLLNTDRIKDLNNVHEVH